MLSIIVAMSKNRVIGNKGKLPWHLASDMTHFRKITWEHVVVMGRKTFESIDVKFRPLSGRRNYVLTHTSWEPTIGQRGIVHLIHEWKEVKQLLATYPTEEIFVIGGESVYKLALPTAKRVYLTTVEMKCDGDTFFPEFEDDKSWSLSEKLYTFQEKDDDYPLHFSLWKNSKHSL